MQSSPCSILSGIVSIASYCAQVITSTSKAASFSSPAWAHVFRNPSTSRSPLPPHHHPQLPHLQFPLTLTRILPKWEDNMIIHRLALKHNVKLGVLQHPHNVILTLSCMTVHLQNVHQRLPQHIREHHTSAPLHHVNSLLRHPHMVFNTGYLLVCCWSALAIAS